MVDVTPTQVLVEAGETVERKLIPTEHAEVDRDVIVKSGAVVTGGIYGDTVEVGDNARIESAILGSTAVELEDCEVYGDVGGPGRIVAEDAYVHSSVSGTTVTLRNCVVRGNVVGTNVRLESCLVLGIVAAESDLLLEDTLCYTFKAFAGGTCSDAKVMIPQAIANEPMTFEDPIQVLGLPISNEPDAAETTLDSEDLVSHDGTTYLTIADRVLDLEGVTDRIEALEELLRTVIDDAAQTDEAECRKTVASALEIEEDRLP